jgi:hypothetical protein
MCVCAHARIQVQMGVNGPERAATSLLYYIILAMMAAVHISRPLFNTIHCIVLK